MAIINSLALGKARKSIGNFTYSTVEGRTIVRMKPEYVRNPNTELQQIQRTKLTAAVLGYQIVGSMCSKTFTLRKKYSSAYNEFVSKNIIHSGGLYFDSHDNQFDINVGAVFGNGSVPNNTIKIDRGDEGFVTMKLIGDNIKSLLKVGDELGFYGRNSGTIVFTNIFKILTAQDIAQLKDDAEFEFSMYGESFAFVAPYWLSADKRRSNSPVLQEL